MKRFLCVLLVLFAVSASTTGIAVFAEEPPNNENVLYVSANGGDPVAVEVGNEFIFFVGVDAGDVKLINCQAEMEYDSDLVSFVPHTAGEYDEVEAYSFPNAIYSAGVVFYTGEIGAIRYNFSRVSGVAVYNNTDKLFARFRFKAIAPGYTDISYVIRYMMDLNERRIFYNSEPCGEFDPTVAVKIEPSEGLIGDADGDYDVSIYDVTYLQRISAGFDLQYDLKTADVSEDGAASLKDAMSLRRYLAGFPTADHTGTWLFASEPIN